MALINEVVIVPKLKVHDLLFCDIIREDALLSRAHPNRLRLGSGVKNGGECPFKPALVSVGTSFVSSVAGLGASEQAGPALLLEPVALTLDVESGGVVQEQVQNGPPPQTDNVEIPRGLLDCLRN